MDIKKIPVGVLQANCYIITKDNESLIIDPGDEVDLIISSAEGKNIKGVLITHHHFDHVGALEKIKDYYHIEEGYDNTNFQIEVIKTPGHTSDSYTYYFPLDNVMFTGDFLFKGTIGRMDLPTGSKIDMKKSLNKIKKYPGNTIVYPGHGDSTILEKEIRNFSYYLNN